MKSFGYQGHHEGLVRHIRIGLRIHILLDTLGHIILFPDADLC